MGKKNNKKKNGIKVEEARPEPKPKSRKKFWVGLGIAGLMFAAAAGIAGSCYNGKKEEPTSKTAYDTSLKERWARVTDEAGYFTFDNELQAKYEVFRENASIQAMPAGKKEGTEKTFFERLNRELAAFENNPVPEMYNEDVFYNLFANNHSLQALLAPAEINAIFNLEQSPILAEFLREPLQDDFKLTERMLSCAILIVHKKLERRDYLTGATMEELKKNLRQGIGDCSDYTYAISNIYYTLCCTLKRDDLASKIRIMMGANIKPDGRFKGYHSWVQLLGPDEKWHDLEMNADQIGPNDPVDMSTHALFIMYDPEGGFYVPLFSAMAINVNNEYKLRLKAHVLPQDGKEKKQ